MLARLNFVAHLKQGVTTYADERGYTASACPDAPRCFYYHRTQPQPTPAGRTGRAGMSTLRSFAHKGATVPANTSWYLPDLGEFRGMQECYTRQNTAMAERPACTTNRIPAYRACNRCAPWRCVIWWKTSSTRNGNTSPSPFSLL